MLVGYPSILCALESAHRGTISAIPPEYDLTFAHDEFDAVETAQQRRFKLILLTCQGPDERYAKACIFIRTFDDETPILFITGRHGLTEEQAQTAGAQGVVCESDQDFAGDLKRRIEGLIDGETKIFNAS